MKNIVNLSIMLFLAVSLNSQNMSWVLSERLGDVSCADFTSCEDNLVCYKLVYTPSESGMITSYTTGFFADCQNAQTAVRINESCIMTDNSREIIACEDHGKILLNCSGNTGMSNECLVKKDENVILHQVCFEVEKQKKICIEKDEVTNLTVSLDRAGKGAITDIPKYVNHFVENTMVCDVNDYNILLDATKLDEQKVLLSWNGKEKEIGSDYSIWKSIDGKNFEKLVDLPNEGESHVEYEDVSGTLGGNYYYIQYRASNKSIILSNTEYVFLQSEQPSIHVYPNPVQDFLFLEFEGVVDEIDCMIYNDVGEFVGKKSIKILDSNRLDLRGLSAGVYTLKFMYNESNITKKIIVIKG